MEPISEGDPKTVEEAIEVERELFSELAQHYPELEGIHGRDYLVNVINKVNISVSKCLLSTIHSLALSL